jgi:hypothetical protein
MENETKRKLAATQVIVKATHTESYYIWCLYAKDSPYKYHPFASGSPKVEWKHESVGFIHEIGKLGDKPVCISGFWSIVNGKRVLFIEMTSMYCDYTLLEPWIKENCPYAEEITDAMNLHGVI